MKSFIRLVFITFTFLFLLNCSQNVFAIDFRFDMGFGSKGIGREKFDRPVDIVVDSKDNIYVLDQGNNRVQKFDEDGDYIDEWGEKGAKEGQFEYPTTLYIDDDDFIYVVDSMNHRIQKFSSEGVFISSVGILGSRYERFNKPQGMGVDRHGDFYIADTKNDRVQQFTKDWKFKRELAKMGPRDEKVMAPSDITFVNYKFGYMYVTSFNNCVVKMFDQKGKYDGEFLLKPYELDSNIEESDSDDAEEMTDEEESVEDEDAGQDDKKEESVEDKDAGQDDKKEESVKDKDAGYDDEEEDSVEDEDTGYDDEDKDTSEYDKEVQECGILKIIVDTIFQDKYLLVIFKDYDSIYVYDYEGNYVSMLSKGKFEFKDPTSVYIKDKSIYVVDGGNNYIHKFKRR